MAGRNPTKLDQFVQLANELDLRVFSKMETNDRTGETKPRTNIDALDEDGKRYFLNWARTDETKENGAPLFKLAVGQAMREQE